MLLSQGLLSAARSPAVLLPCVSVISTTLKSCYIISLSCQVLQVSKHTVHGRIWHYNAILWDESSSISPFLYLWISLCLPWGKHLLRVYHQKQLLHMLRELPRLGGKIALLMGRPGWLSPRLSKKSINFNFGLLQSITFQCYTKRTGVMMNYQTKQCTCTRNFPQINHIPSGKLT